MREAGLRSICTICSTILAGVKTTNAETHLRTRHPDTYINGYRLLKMNWAYNKKT